MTLASMTGFARSEGAGAGPMAWSWAWELRSVNGRGLELRFRLPGGFDALEPGLRERAGRQAALRAGEMHEREVARAAAEVGDQHGCVTRQALCKIEGGGNRLVDMMEGREAELRKGGLVACSGLYNFDLSCG